MCDNACRLDKIPHSNEPCLLINSLFQGRTHLYIDCIWPSLSLQTHSAMLDQRFSVSPSEGAIQKVSSVQLYPRPVGVHLQSIPRDWVLETVAWHADITTTFRHSNHAAIIRLLWMCDMLQFMQNVIEESFCVVRIFIKFQE